MISSSGAAEPPLALVDAGAAPEPRCRIDPGPIAGSFTVSWDVTMNHTLPSSAPRGLLIRRPPQGHIDRDSDQRHAQLQTIGGHRLGISVTVDIQTRRPLERREIAVDGDRLDQIERARVQEPA